MQPFFYYRSKKNQLEGPPPFIEFDASKPIQNRKSMLNAITFNRQEIKPKEKPVKEQYEPKKGNCNNP